MIITTESPEYEQTRIGSMWGKRTPDRRPSAFIPATTADDVADAVRLATTQDLPITVRAGGHNWSGSHLRDGAVVIDVSAMDEVSVDEESMTAVAGPGVGGSILAEELDSMGLFFPAGPCRGVKLGGYLLQGGAGDPALRALAHFVHVYVDAETRRPVPIPEPIKAAVETLPRVDS